MAATTTGSERPVSGAQMQLLGSCVPAPAHWCSFRRVAWLDSLGELRARALTGVYDAAVP